VLLTLLNHGVGDSVASGGVFPEAAPDLLLRPEERTREALTAAGIAVEHARVVGPSDSRSTAAYAASVIDNSRRLA
jgi:hypothetical protein